MCRKVIKVENLSKRYRIGVKEEHKTLAGQAINLITYPIKNFQKISQMTSFKDQDDPSIFWALRELNFEVNEGEVLGIIGKNGAGKSTLLKILSKITEPSKGLVKIKGRVSSLLEVGTGFHPELTGRDNVYMNGTIHGMTKKEIDRKFEEIVHFSGVEKHIDTPVKFYSSGMTVRLGFAVAAHLEPEILIVDEVLAVGDAEFQKKCLGKMGEVSKSGRTILFVTHNLSSARSLCSRGILLEKGKLTHDGSIVEVLANYMNISDADNYFRNEQDADNDTWVKEGELRLDPKESQAEITLQVESTKTIRNMSIDLRLKDFGGLPVAFGSIGTFSQKDLVTLSKGKNTFKFRFPFGNLAEGTYSISIDLTIPNISYLARLEDCFSFELARELGDNYRILNQKWQYGSYELPLQLS